MLSFRPLCRITCRCLRLSVGCTSCLIFHSFQLLAATDIVFRLIVFIAAAFIFERHFRFSHCLLSLSPHAFPSIRRCLRHYAPVSLSSYMAAFFFAITTFRCPSILPGRASRQPTPFACPIARRLMPFSLWMSLRFRCLQADCLSAAILKLPAAALMPYAVIAADAFIEAFAGFRMELSCRLIFQLFIDTRHCRSFSPPASCYFRHADFARCFRFFMLTRLLPQYRCHCRWLFHFSLSVSIFAAFAFCCLRFVRHFSLISSPPLYADIDAFFLLRLLLRYSFHYFLYFIDYTIPPLMSCERPHLLLLFVFLRRVSFSRRQRPPDVCYAR